MTEFSRGAIEAKAVELHAEQCPIWDCPYGVTASWRHYAEGVLQAETEAKAETTTATDEDAARIIESTAFYTGARTIIDGQKAAQALADAGLLATDRPETTAEWGVSWPKDGDGYVARVSQEKSARFVANRDGGVVVRREVTAWTEVG